MKQGFGQAAVVQDVSTNCWSHSFVLATASILNDQGFEQENQVSAQYICMIRFQNPATGATARINYFDENPLASVVVVTPLGGRAQQQTLRYFVSANGSQPSTEPASPRLGMGI
jgi:hypothetical protein